MSTIVAQTLSNGSVSTSTANCISGSAKAWVNFNGTTSPGTINASFNVSSVTRNGTGDYTVNFTNAFANTNYATVGSVKEDESTNTGGTSSFRLARFTQSTSAIRVASFAGNTGSLLNCIQVNVVCYL